MKELGGLINEKKDDSFEREIREQLDFLLKATEIESALDRIKQCEEKTSNNPVLCCNDILMAINLGILLLDSICKKFEKKIDNNSIRCLKEEYEELNKVVSEIDESATTKIIGLMIVDNLNEIHRIIGEIKVKLI